MLRIRTAVAALLLVAGVARAQDLEDFEGSGDAAAWRCAEWAEATRGQSVVQGAAGASSGASALQVGVSFGGQGYAQGFVGRPARLDLRDAAALAVDVTLPAGAPAGLRAKVILQVGAGWRWVEPAEGTALAPGTTTIVRLALAGAVDDPPARADLGDVVGYGVKVEGERVAWSGVVALDRVRVERLRGSPFGPEVVRPVGVFGGYVRDGKADIPRRNGYLTFVADADLGAHALRWPKLGPKDGDLRLGQLEVGGAPFGAVAQRVVDWTTLELRGQRVGLAGRFDARATLSRAFPAVRWRTTGRQVEWVTGLDGRARAGRVAVVLDGRPTVYDLVRGGTIDLSRMSEPWVLVWAGPARGWTFDAPVLLTFERRPRRARTSGDGLVFERDGQVGCVQAMPLSGLRRRSTAETAAWDAGLPGPVLNACRTWVPRLAAFPVGCVETAAVEGDRVRVTDAWRHEAIFDDWGTIPTPVAPLPPAIVQAAANGYPVRYPGGAPETTDVATYFGPFAFQRGARSTYDLPAPAGARRLPVALRVEGDATAAGVRVELERWVRDRTPAPVPNFIDNNDRAACFLAEAYPTLPEDLRAIAREAAPRLIEVGYRASSLQTLTEPVTGQRYLNGAQYWCSNEPFDKEWYTGRQLAALAVVSETFDLGLARAVWPQALGLYRYDQLFFDWATGSTLSSVYGYTALCDGVHFAWEGMLGMARLADLLGDRRTRDDALHHAARQQAALFALWSQAAWARELDYAVGHLTHTKLPRDAVETAGGVDGFVEETGCTTLEMRSFWQTSNYLFFDNLPQASFYRDFGLDRRVQRILDDVVPRLHPAWRDGDVKDAVDGRYYGAECTAAHLIARALLLHEDPAPLFDIYLSNRTKAQSNEWYTMHRFGMAGPTLLAIERARAPVVEVPSTLALESSVFDAARGEVRLTVVARRDVDTAVRVNGADVRVRLRAGERRVVRAPAAAATPGLVGAFGSP